MIDEDEEARKERLFDAIEWLSRDLEVAGFAAREVSRALQAFALGIAVQTYGSESWASDAVSMLDALQQENLNACPAMH